MSRTTRTRTSFTSPLGRWLPGLYDELRDIARRFMSRERIGHTLQPTALVHEAFLRLSRSSGLRVSSEIHAKALAAQTMRRVLVDHARRDSFQKRCGAADHAALDEDRMGGSDPLVALVELNDALEALGRLNPRQARVIELRFFSGLSLEEVAAVMGISERTVTYESRAGCAWLKAEMAKAAAP